MKWLGISQLRTATTNNSKYLPLPLPLFEQGTSKDSFPLKYQQNNNGRQYHQYRSTGSRRRGGENTWLPYITRRVTNFGVNFGHIIGTEEWKWNGQAGMMMHAAVVLINVLHVCYICLISCLCRCLAVLMFAYGSWYVDNLFAYFYILFPLHTINAIVIAKHSSSYQKNYCKNKNNNRS